MAQLLQMGQKSQQKLARRQDAQQHQIEMLTRSLSQAHASIREQQATYTLITINQLSTMLGNIWDEKQKISMGGKLSIFSKIHHVSPTKVPHPTLPNGVNAYKPGIVKAWLEENNMPVPSELLYVD